MDALTGQKLRSIFAPRVQLDVCCAKKITSSRWTTAYLRNQTLLARESYIPRYGNVGTTDRFDEHAAVYIVRAQYKSTTGECLEEWLSARFIVPYPCLSQNESHELLQSLYLGTPILSMLSRVDPIAAQTAAVVSRICGYREVAQDNGVFSDKKDYFLPLKYTAPAFMLMVDQFLSDYKCTAGPRLILGLFRDELIRKALLVSTKRKIFPNFQFGTVLFTGSSRKDFCIDRLYSAYDFPSYFLNTEKLGRALCALLKSGYLHKDSVAVYLSQQNFLELLLSGKTLPYYTFRNMGKLLTHVGMIPGTALPGDTLRLMLDKKVSDGPELRVLKTENFAQNSASRITQLIRTP